MAKPLTPITIANLRARAQRYEVSDGGCAGLRVVVFPTKKKSFVVRYRYRGLQRKLTLGACLTERDVAEHESAPQANTPLSLAAARELTTKALRQARAGNDPAAAKARKRQEELAAESDTLQAISEEFLRREGGKLRTLDQRRADLKLLCDSALGRLPLEQIRRGQFARVFDSIADERGPVRSDRVLAALSRLLTWHANRSDFVNPLSRGMRRTSTKERARSRILADDELRAVWTAAERDEGPFGAYVRFVLLTATRRGEAAGLRWDELVDGGKTWVIPGARYKNGRDVLLPLSQAAQDIIAAAPQLGDFVFSADGSRPLGGFDDRKAEFDKACGVSGYVLHDLRRTARTLLSRAGVNADIAERCLGHALTGVRGTYDRHSFESEKRAAFEALAAQIERIVRPPTADVTDMAAERERRGQRRQP
jgi:integrase